MCIRSFELGRQKHFSLKTEHSAASYLVIKYCDFSERIVQQSACNQSRSCPLNSECDHEDEDEDLNVDDNDQEVESEESVGIFPTILSEFLFFAKE